MTTARILVVCSQSNRANPRLLPSPIFHPYLRRPFIEKQHAGFVSNIEQLDLRDRLRQAADVTLHASRPLSFAKVAIIDVGPGDSFFRLHRSSRTVKLWLKALRFSWNVHNLCPFQTIHSISYNWLIVGSISGLIFAVLYYIMSRSIFSLFFCTMC